MSSRSSGKVHYDVEIIGEQADETANDQQVSYTAVLSTLGFRAAEI